MIKRIITALMVCAMTLGLTAYGGGTGKWTAAEDGDAEYIWVFEGDDLGTQPIVFSVTE
ncbi:MAG: hypothetical protein LBS19_02300 [Clostridiales bacterium]|jgi:hypothetical protein|nr:hypothetical protein [Clostridiales bacterium]